MRFLPSKRVESNALGRLPLLQYMLSIFEEMSGKRCKALIVTALIVTALIEAFLNVGNRLLLVAVFLKFQRPTKAIISS